MTTFIDEIKSHAQKEYHFDPLTEPKESIYQPDQAGLIFPGRPRFDDPKDERRYRKERLVGACGAFARANFSDGFAGHLTIRDPEYPDPYGTNAMAL